MNFMKNCTVSNITASEYFNKQYANLLWDVWFADQYRNELEKFENFSSLNIQDVPELMSDPYGSCRVGQSKQTK